METPTALVIGQLAAYMRGLTRRLDPGAGWYGEFLRRDPEGMRACLDGVAMPPWDVLESLLGDLPGDPEATAREAAYAAGLRAAAVAAWDAVPGGEGELRALLGAAEAQWAASEAALRSLADRLDGARDREEAAGLARELAWTRDDASRAAARAADLTARLRALPTPVRLAGVPRQREGHEPSALPESRQPGQARVDGAEGREPGQAPLGRAEGGEPGPAPVGSADGREPVRTPGGRADGGEPVQAPVGRAETREPRQAPVGRAEGRWLRGARRAGGARYAGATPPAAPAPVPASDPAAPLPAPRGARFAGQSAAPAPTPPEADPATSGYAPSEPWPAPPAVSGGGAGQAGHALPDGPWPAAVARAPEGDLPTSVPGPGGPRAGFVAELVALREQGRSGEAHALLCEAAAWPAGYLPGLADGLGRAGLAADWATLLWEAASLPPDRLAAAAAALGEAGRDADCDRLLRQGVARPAVEVADAALALGAAGRDREARALLGAFVRLRTAEEAAALARRDPHWFAPRLLDEARALSGTRHRDLAHALRVAGIPAS
ncbi:hypothetical protein [Streptomyces sp. NPDC059564]|uniref:hypothetical protein n=1 Tax=Streptomyces sp. NPDC059564 TaxID=3346865 RepID=UPI0036B5694C